MGKAVPITEEKDFRAIFSSKENAIIYFTATWCGPCKMVSPQFGKLSNLNSKFKFYKLDNDEMLDIFRECKVTSIPYFKKVVAGEIVDDLLTVDPDILSNWVLKE
ncbi:predicted protein [Naegleria gruberi]|uniref:Predicted protein n=1 Tax=Naegleria gruberi TaxID=5762 RepID=D2VI58_NAEGR|nr:uncharacterized protein NAEGRDRAFT_34269 [Naegleria gruberi]EFC43534.1 predicted protein [Naegleria gruberi]|eukprot:XP_002676278.1 predicted protein [Naegleria gruberi strain NEG-M]